MKVVAITLIGIACAAASVDLRAQSHAFQLDDLSRIVRITDPQIAPDGRTIAIVVARADLDANRWDSQVMLVDVASAAVRQVTRGRRGVGHPRWSPDGRSLAFIARSDDAADAHADIRPVPAGRRRGAHY